MPELLRKIDGLIERLPVSPRFVRFGLVGGSGVVVNLGILWVLEHLLLPPFPAGWEAWHHRSAMAGAIAVSIFTNFLLNDLWTWGDRAKGGAAQWGLRLAKFYGVSCVAASLQWAVAVVLFEQLDLRLMWGELDLWLYLAQIVGIGAALVINFVMNHLWTFRDREAAAAPEPGPEAPEEEGK